MKQKISVRIFVKWSVDVIEMFWMHPMLLKGFFNLTEIFSINFQRLTEIASELSILLNDTKRSFSAQQNSDSTCEYTKRTVVNAGRCLLLLHTLLPLIVRFFIFN